MITGTAGATAVGEGTACDELSGVCVLDSIAVEDVLGVVVLAVVFVDVLVVESPVIVVRDRGTAVHRFPLSVVMINPAGRLAFDDIMESEELQIALLN